MTLLALIIITLLGIAVLLISLLVWYLYLMTNRCQRCGSTKIRDEKRRICVCPNKCDDDLIKACFQQEK